MKKILTILTISLITSISTVIAVSTTLPTPTSQPEIKILAEYTCPSKQAVILAPGFGVNTDFFTNLAKRFDGQNGNPCFSTVYGINYRNVSDGYTGIIDTPASSEGSFKGWATDIQISIQNIEKNNTWDKNPVLVAWSSGNVASLYMLQQQTNKNPAFPSTPLAAYFSLNGVPTVDAEWKSRDSGVWGAEMTALHPLILDYSGQACVFSFQPSIWSLFLFSKTYSSLDANGTSITLLNSSTLPSPEKVVFDMTGIARSGYNLNGGMTQKSCKQAKFITDTTNTSIVHDIDPNLFINLGLHVTFIGAAKDLVIPSSITKGQWEYFCSNATGNCSYKILEDSPHAGFSSDEYTTKNNLGETVPVADEIAEIIVTHL